MPLAKHRVITLFGDPIIPSQGIRTPLNIEYPTKHSHNRDIAEQVFQVQILAPACVGRGAKILMGDANLSRQSPSSLGHALNVLSNER